MPYYHVINGGTFAGEKEISGIIHWRPISFVTPLEIGSRQHGIAGKRQIQIEIMSHEDARLRVQWGSVNLILRHHEQKEETNDVIDLGAHPLSLNTQPDKTQVIAIEKGAELPLYKTSLIIEGHEEEKLLWSPRMDDPIGL